MDDSIEKIVSLAKRRGFVYPSSEIYGGLAAIYDYGPYGAELFKNITDSWWKFMIQDRADVVGLNSAIFMSPRVWEASGHVGGFSDPLIECKNCNNRMRADHVLEEIGVQADEKMTDDEINKLIKENADKIKCDACGKSEFADARSFNLLVKTNLGDFTGKDDEPVYLRGETAQGIYVNYKNVVDTMRVKIPFGIGQFGKAFRNEITARQFTFRTREFTQMEMQYFVHPNDAKKFYEYWKEERMKHLEFIGLPKEKLQWHQHENLVFYANDAWDIEYKFPFGWKELEGLHDRGDYDLTTHAKHSGAKLEWFDQENNDRYVPHVVETAIGADRLTLAVLCEAYNEEEVDGETRVVLKFHPKLAPVKIAVLPLSKKEELQGPAKEIFDALKHDFVCEYDETQSIGKRYRRQDEIGTPYCVTIDFDSLEDKSVTIRDRDTMKQERIAIADLPEYFAEKLA